MFVGSAAEYSIRRLLAHELAENGATSGIGLLATYGYDNLGRRISLTRGNGTVTSYAWDAASRLQTLAQDLAGATHDLTLGFAYNPAVDGVTLPRGAGQSTAYLRNGIAFMSSSRDQLVLIAHEVGHHLQFRQGLTISRYLSESWNRGYTDNMYEVIARDFAEAILRNWG